jgi:DNA-binding IclR family transcriptional regulator
VVDILAAIEGSAGLTLSQVAREARLLEPTCLRYLSALVAHGLVDRDEESGRYQLGIRLFQLGQRALRERDPRRAALLAMRQLRSRFDETVNVAVPFGDNLVLVEALESTRSIKKSAKVGEFDVWHSSSLGKAILAYLPEQEAIRILERRGCPRSTSKALTTVKELLRDFEHVRERGMLSKKRSRRKGCLALVLPSSTRMACRATPSA